MVVGVSSGPREVGRLLRAMRESAGMTQDALARASGCSKAYLSLVESGQRRLSADKARDIEAALDVHDGRLLSAIQWQQVPEAVRAQVELTATRSAAITRQLRAALRSEDPLSMLRDLVAQSASNVEAPASLPLRLGGRPIPIINKVAAGYPHEFTDLDYPASVADEHLACPDVSDPDAFAARVVGDSMEPEYHEGDIVVFSPQAPTVAGGDCFVRLERDAETTFKRVYFEDDGRSIRLQPLNSAYPPRTVDREDVAGLYAAVYVLRKIRAA
jgi:phage repressor protein C with HTH and peptisase S24 domain/DNA-binding XRE family transcriptional regulator